MNVGHGLDKGAGSDRPSSGSRPTTAVSITDSVAGFKAASLAAVRPMSLAAINARLNQYALEHEWTSDGGLADFGAVLHNSVASGDTTGREVTGAASAGPGRPTSPQSMRGQQVVAGSSTSQPTPLISAAHTGSEAGSTMRGNGKRDYLREQRQAKEVAERCVLYTTVTVLHALSVLLWCEIMSHI
jgi:hypothetical protein